MAEKKGIAIIGTGRSVEAEVNTAEIQQVIANLVANAIHAMSKPGTIEVKTERVMGVPPEKRDAHAEWYARLSVQDDGPGIAPDILPFIFDPFFTTKDVGEGTGLGLSVTYGIVQDHGGWIDVDTKLGSGTSFTLSAVTGRRRDRT